jgi:hypothetical protein
MLVDLNLAYHDRAARRRDRPAFCLTQNHFNQETVTIIPLIPI